MDINLIIVLGMFVVGSAGSAMAMFFLYRSHVSVGKTRKDIEELSAAGKASDKEVSAAIFTADKVDKDIADKLKVIASKEEAIKSEIESKVDALKKTAEKTQLTVDESKERYKALGYDVEDF